MKLRWLIDFLAVPSGPHLPHAAFYCERLRDAKIGDVFAQACSDFLDMFSGCELYRAVLLMSHWVSSLCFVFLDI